MMRRGLLISGLVVLAGVWFGPLPELAREAFYAHMTMHMTVVAVAAPLLALGIARGRYDPVRRWPAPFHPIAASVVELIIVWTWHAPGLHHFARGSTVGLLAEQATFLGAGLLLWLSAFGGGAVDRSTVDGGRWTVGRLDGWTVGRFGAGGRRVSGEDGRGRIAAVGRGRAAAGIVGLLLTAMHMTLLGALLALAGRPLFHAEAAEVAGMTALQDQHLGGAIMILVGGVSYLAGGLYLTVGLLRRPFAESDPGVMRGSISETSR